MALDPLLPRLTSRWLAHGLFTHYAAARGWGEHAIASARQALDLDPMSPAANVDLAWIQEMEKAIPVHGDAPAPLLAMLGAASGLAGRTRTAREVLERMEELARRCYVSPYDWAVLRTGLGEHNEALRCRRQALEERSPRMIWLHVEPAFDSLRQDRRFERLSRHLA